MAENHALKQLSKALSQARILLAADVDYKLVRDVDQNILIARLIELHKNDTGVSVADRAQIAAIIDEMSTEKMPKPVEVIRRGGFNSIAAEVDADYQIGNTEHQSTEGTVNDFVNYFRNRMEKVRRMIEERRVGGALSPSIESMKGYTSGREAVVLGIVSNKVTTKNGNLMAVIEDETGDFKVIFINGSSQESKALFENGRRLINDEVVAIKGKISNQFLIAQDIVWPDIPIKEKKKTEDDIAIAFTSDIHVGSKQFMEKNFSHMLKWLNGDVDTQHSDIPAKIKYMIMAGDVADGIGIYPDQEYDLAIPDIYMQYRMLFTFLESIPDYIHVFLMPGNHDAVQRAEPQPPLGEDIVKDFKLDNVHIISNPSSLRLHGLDVLAYHGTSLDSMISAIPGSTYASPEKTMVEMLKRRHLSPIYGGNVVVPSKEDHLVIEDVPDILHMGHIHKNGISEYHGVGIVNSGTWQARTNYQIRSGHIPTPCILPVYETKSSTFTTVSFENG